MNCGNIKIDLWGIKDGGVSDIEHIEVQPSGNQRSARSDIGIHVNLNGSKMTRIFRIVNDPQPVFKSLQNLE